MFPQQKPLRVVSEVGRRVPLHSSAIGKCLLAFSEIPLPEQMKRYTDRTIVEIRQLELELEQIRFQGYAVDDEELTLGVRGIASPIRNREGRTIATIGLSGPSVRLTLDIIPKFAELLVKSSQDISAELGFSAT